MASFQLMPRVKTNDFEIPKKPISKLKAILVFDRTLLHSLNNVVHRSLVNTLSDYFKVLWTTSTIDTIPKEFYNHHIRGFRNGRKPINYLRQHLRHINKKLLILPIIIIDLEETILCEIDSYDLAINVESFIFLEQESLIKALDLKNMFQQINESIIKFQEGSKILHYEFDYNLSLKTFKCTQTDNISDARVFFRSNTITKKKVAVLVTNTIWFEYCINSTYQKLYDKLNTFYIVIWLPNIILDQNSLQKHLDIINTLSVGQNLHICGLVNGIQQLKYLRYVLPKNMLELPCIIVDKYLYTNGNNLYNDYDLILDLNRFSSTNGKQILFTEEIFETIDQFIDEYWYPIERPESIKSTVEITEESTEPLPSTTTDDGQVRSLEPLPSSLSLVPYKFNEFHLDPNTNNLVNKISYHGTISVPRRNSAKSKHNRGVKRSK